MKLTIFTPTYNRAYILDQLYQSLLRQSCHAFEWLIVDDGSTDDTEALVRGWTEAENPFPIRYHRQENGGKHRAINTGVKLAQGELFFIVDSDDRLPPDSIARTLHWVGTLPEDSRNAFCGICGLKAFSMEEAVGTSFSGEWIDCTCLERDAHGISGDKAEVFFTDVMRRYPFPTFDGENFVTEAVVWDRMAADGYRLRFFNEVIYLCEYRNDGLTNQGLNTFLRNPYGYALYLRQCRKFGKFSPALLNYHEVQYCLHWLGKMPLAAVSEQLGRPAMQLLLKVGIYKLRRCLSSVRQHIIHLFRRNK